MTRDDAKLIMRESQGMARSYRQHGQVDERCAVAASNTGIFILKAAGFSNEELKALKAEIDAEDSGQGAADAADQAKDCQPASGDANNTKADADDT